MFRRTLLKGLLGSPLAWLFKGKAAEAKASGMFCSEDYEPWTSLLSDSLCDGNSRVCVNLSINDDYRYSLRSHRCHITLVERGDTTVFIVTRNHDEQPSSWPQYESPKSEYSLDELAERLEKALWSPPLKGSDDA